MHVSVTVTVADAAVPCLDCISYICMLAIYTIEIHTIPLCCCLGHLQNELCCHGNLLPFVQLMYINGMHKCGQDEALVVAMVAPVTPPPHYGDSYGREHV